jgi:hypothetical protein
LLERRVGSVLCEALKKTRVEEPVVRSEGLGDESGEGGVALKYPATGRYTVGDVRAVSIVSTGPSRDNHRLTSDPCQRNLEDCGQYASKGEGRDSRRTDEIVEHDLDQPRVQLGDSIDLVRADDSEVGHPDVLRVTARIVSTSRRGKGSKDAPLFDETHPDESCTVSRVLPLDRLKEVEILRR